MIDVTARAATAETTGRPWARRTVLLVAWAFLAAVVVQVFLAGGFVFGAIDPGLHILLGYTLPLLPLIMLIVGAVGRLAGGVIGLTAILLVLTILQQFLPGLRVFSGWLAALHVINALAIFAIAHAVVQRLRASEE